MFTAETFILFKLTVHMKKSGTKTVLRQFNSGVDMFSLNCYFCFTVQNLLFSKPSLDILYKQRLS